MGRVSVTVYDGPLEDEVFALDVSPDDEVPFRLGDGRTAIYRVNRTLGPPEKWTLRFIGIDPYA